MNTLLTLKFAAWVVIIEIAFTDDFNKKENKRRCCWQLEEKKFGKSSRKSSFFVAFLMYCSVLAQCCYLHSHHLHLHSIIIQDCIVRFTALANQTCIRDFSFFLASSVPFHFCYTFYDIFLHYQSRPSDISQLTQFSQ